MAFPNDPRPLLFELQIGATDWANVTSDTYSKRQNVDVDWGVPGEYSQSGPTVCTFQLNNRAGRYSPRNPLSPFYGLIGKNTPVRWSIGEGAYGLVLGAGGTSSTGRAASLDSTQLSPTGDIDVRIDLEILPDSAQLWSTGNFDLIGKYNNNDADRAYSLIVVGGKPRLNWFTTGLTGSARTATSSVALPGTTGRLAVRATLDVNNGAAGVDVKFYTAPTMAGPWTQLGTTQTSAGTSSVFNSGAWTRVGAFQSASSWSWGVAPAATVYSAQIYGSINGTNLLASPDFTTQPLDPVPFASSAFNDAQGNNWFYEGGADQARIWYGDVDTRFWGECSAFPNRWDTSNNDAWVPIEAAGILRRMGRRSQPASNGLRDWIESQSVLPASYFPLSGAEGTTYSMNQGRIRKNSTRFYGENGPFFTYGKTFDGAEWLDTGMEINATGPASDFRGDVATVYNNLALDFVFQSPVITTDSGVLDTNIGMLDIYVWSYDYDRFWLRLQNPTNTGVAQIGFYGADGTGTVVNAATGALAALQDNNLHTCRMEIETIGSTPRMRLYIDGILIDTVTAGAPRPWNGTWTYIMNYSRYAGQTVFNIAHLTGWADTTTAARPAVADFDEAARGYSGETAGDRLVRIASLSAIPLTISGDAADTMPMGVQYTEPRLSQLRDAENADMGILGEPRDRFGLQYRTRVSMVGQTPALTLDYSAGHLVPPFEPTDDDQLTRNDVTASRRGGDSYRYRQLTGRMSVLEPPDGVGAYADETEVNVQTDALLAGVATWLVNLGTVDQARYPFLTVDLGNLVAAGLDAAARAVKFGDLVVVTGMESLGVYDDVRLLILGGHETVSDGGYKHTIAWNCAPYQGYEGSVYATSASVGTARYDADGSTLAAGINSAVTSFQVTNTSTVWTNDAAAFPFDVMMGGERITVGTITGTGTTQTLGALTRGVNGVVKAHSAGETVQLADPAYYSL
jgi:hypothetical protein